MGFVVSQVPKSGSFDRLRTGSGAPSYFPGGFAGGLRKRKRPRRRTVRPWVRERLDSVETPLKRTKKSQNFCKRLFLGFEVMGDLQLGFRRGFRLFCWAGDAQAQQKEAESLADGIEQVHWLVLSLLWVLLPSVPEGRDVRFRGKIAKNMPFSFKKRGKSAKC